MEIREVIKEDIEQIISLLRQVEELHYINMSDIFKMKSEDEIEEYIIDIFENEEKKMIVAVNEAIKVCGILVYRIKYIKYHVNLKPAKILWIEELCVDENSRKKGIGKTLMLEAEKATEKLKCDRIELNCWEFNENAIKFYEEIGMIKQRIIMEKQVGGDKNEIF